MKTLNLISACILFGFCVAHAQYKTSEEAIHQLQTYKSLELQKREKDSKPVKLLDQVFKDLDASVKFSLKKKADAKLIAEIGRVSLLTYEKDPTQYAAEIVYPLYQKDKKHFQKSIQSLPESQQKALLESLENFEREEREGNG